MKAKYGAIVVAGSGKINGFVASRNRAGAYFRTKVTPVNPNTSFQTIVRNRLGSISSAWRGLTAVERASWNAAVSNFARTDIFGDLKNPSGFNLFQRLNNNLDSVSQAMLTVVPAVDAVESERIVSFIVDDSSNTAVLTLSGPVPAGSALKISASPGLSPGINFVKSEYRIIRIEPPSATSPIDVNAFYLTRFGAPVTGQKIFIEIQFVDILTGLTSVKENVSTIVVA